MSGEANFPTALDDDTSLFDVSDSVSTLQAAHHNNIKEAVKALESKVGVDNTSVPTALDARLGHPTMGHVHNGASGQGQLISPTALGTALDRRFTESINLQGSAVVGTNVAAPIAIGRTAQIESLSAVLRRGPSGATASFNVKVGPTSIPVSFPPGATYFGNPSPGVTYPSGAIVTLDTTVVGSSAPGQDLSVVFVFRESN